MDMHIFQIATIIVAFSATAIRAQNSNCGALNTNNNCLVGVNPEGGVTVYYAPTDSGDIEVLAEAEGTCDAGTFADVGLFYTTGYDSTSNYIGDCGCLPLDGNAHVLDCSGVDKGTIPEGGYNFLISLNARYDAIAYFTITHSQFTSTAAAPTNTVSTTTYETSEVTLTSTETDTTTAAPATVTSPAGTTDITATVTPSPATLTVTKTRTRKYRETDIVVVEKTVTKKSPCTTASLEPLSHFDRVSDKALHPRQQSQNGYTGDGPPTTTVTSDAVVVTQTVDGGTQTSTDMAYTTTTATVQPTPPTMTVYTGTAVQTDTTTLPVSTGTATHHTVARVTKTYTKTVSFTFTTHVTPTCKPTRKR